MQLNQNAAAGQERRFEPPESPDGGSAPGRDSRSLTDLLRELSQESSTLFRQEVALAKTELAENIARALGHTAKIAAGAGLALAGGLALLWMVIYGLQALLVKVGVPLGVAWWLSPLVVGLALAAVGYFLVKRGVEALKQETIAPRKTTETLEETKEWMKDKLT